MFFIFGTRASELASEKLEFVRCGNCDSEALVATLMQRYFHLFWIPTVPIGRVVATECMHCRQVLVDRDVPASLDRVLEPLRSAKTPVWSFSGAMVVGAFMLVGAIASLGSGEPRIKTSPPYSRGPSANTFDSRSASVSASTTPTWDLLLDPQRDDIYVLDFVDAFDLEETENRIGVMQATSVGSDSVTFRVARMSWPSSYEATTDIDRNVMKEAGRAPEADPDAERCDHRWIIMTT